jgi:hypothetical protein
MQHTVEQQRYWSCADLIDSKSRQRAVIILVELVLNDGNEDPEGCFFIL